MIKTLTFDDEGLIVDWLAFKIESLDCFQEKRLVHYLFAAGFNCYSRSKNSTYSPKVALEAHPNNCFEVVFLKDIPYWNGIILQFSGIHGSEFYQWLKRQETIEWGLFQNLRLSRFDLHYTDQTNMTEEEVELFFQECQQNPNIQNSNINIVSSKNKRGHILRMGRRTSDRFSRIYTRNHTLRFEHEMKGRFIDQYSNIFLDRCWEKFEDLMSQHFLQYFGKYLPIDSVYLDWLVLRLRSIRPEPVPNLIFKMDYIHKIDNIEDQRKVVQFLKFLIYAKDLYYVTENLGTTRYRCINFRVQDFLKFQDPTCQKGIKHKIQNMKKFFEQFETDFFLSMFRHQRFQKMISIPKIEFWREGNRYWVAQIWIVDELFYYNYPFAFPDLFDPNISKTKFAVQFEVIRVFSNVGLEKRFQIQQFLNTYPSALSNQQIRQMKEFFIEAVEVLEKHNLIQPRFKIIRMGSLQSVEKLTLENIVEGFVLYEQLNFLEVEE
jgi:hypothetical protein